MPATSRSSLGGNGWDLLPLYFVVFLLEAALFYPGVISPDAVDMMLQGTVWPYHTWHSVPFAWVWQLLQKIVKGPALMFFLINAGFLGGLLGAIFGKTSRRGDSIATMATKTAVRTVTSQVAGQITRGLLGSILGGRRR